MSGRSGAIRGRERRAFDVLLTITSSTSFMVGVAPSTLSHDMEGAYGSCGFYFLCHSTGLLYGVRKQHEGYGAPMTEPGDIVKVRLDCDAHTLRLRIAKNIRP